MDIIARYESWRLTRQIARLTCQLDGAIRRRQELDRSIRLLSIARARARLMRLEAETLGANHQPTAKENHK